VLEAFGKESAAKKEFAREIFGTSHFEFREHHFNPCPTLLNAENPMPHTEPHGCCMILTPESIRFGQDISMNLLGRNVCQPLLPLSR
jgi:hypothetical protein